MDKTWGIKIKDPENRRSDIKFLFRYRPMAWLVAYGIVSLPGPSPPLSAAGISQRNASPVVQGQGLLFNEVAKIENSPSPQGMMLAPSRSKKATSSRSNKGKEVARSPSVASTSSNPLSIVSHLLESLFNPLTNRQPQFRLICK